MRTGLMKAALFRLSAVRCIPFLRTLYTVYNIYLFPASIL